ncbi:hypothetical protein DE146DRAFT_725578 [Phaeosphaeria sp. MPI-PUGE-AT-0046c]|nr:hypothetical protein DE146DRAFT_725578 [Phaeosphaeria sp. MPI-PUGE-AT-0046c]
MSADFLAHKHTTQRRTKAKSGCLTCRIRKIKCDEIKPFCRKCTSTGRTCDGYDSLFKAYKRNGDSHSSLQPILRASDKITAQDIASLNRCFSVKTVFDIKLECDMEAKAVLEASLTDRSIQYAVSALKALRQDFERSSDAVVVTPQPSPIYKYGLEQYCLALEALTSSQSCPSSQGLTSTLLCCQIFICIEQVQQNYATMAQHIMQGLNIMHQFRARPYLNADRILIPAHGAPLPHLDVFLIKMFSAPCKFADASVKHNGDEGATPVCPISSSHGLGGHHPHRNIAPDMRGGLTRIATMTLEFLNKVSQVRSVSDALQLVSEKVSLRRSLDSWLNDLDGVQPRGTSPSTELISVSFLRLFHQTLLIIVLGALESSSNVGLCLEVEHASLQHIASDLGRRLRTYRMCHTP